MNPKPLMKVRYSRRDRCFIVNYPAMQGGKQNASFVVGKLMREELDFASLLSPSVLAELEARGFDTNGIVITIPIKPEVLMVEGTSRFLHEKPTPRPEDK